MGTESTEDVLRMIDVIELMRDMVLNMVSARTRRRE
jgi:hypothetical protein